MTSGGGGLLAGFQVRTWRCCLGLWVRAHCQTWLMVGWCCLQCPQRYRPGGIPAV